MSEPSEKPIVLSFGDAAANRQLLSSLLEGEYILRWAEEADVGLTDRHTANLPDLVLLDPAPPGLHGRDVLRQLRVDALTRDIPVIVVTADDAEETELEWLQRGANAVLVKPFKPRGLKVKVHDLLERQRLKKQLAESEAWRGVVFEAGPNPLLVVAQDGRILSANHRAEAMLGYPSGRLVGLNVEQLVAAEDHQSTAGYFAVEQCAPQQRSRFADGVELLALRHDGSHFPARISLHPIQFGQATRLIVGLEDISALKTAQTEVKISEERLRLATEGVKDGTWDWNLDSGSVFCSAGWKSMLGYSDDDVVEPTFAGWAKWMHADDKAAVMQGVEDYLAGRGDKFEIEIRMHRKDGSWADILSRASLARDTEGHPLQPRRLIGINTDITERKRMERALRQSDARFRGLFDQSPDPRLLIEDDRFVDCNQAAVELLGSPDKAEILGTHPADISPETQPDGVPSAIKSAEMMRIAKQRGTHRFDWAHKRSDGSRFIAEVTLSSITIQDRPMLHCIWRDITTAKENEVMLERDRERQKVLRKLLEDGFAKGSLEDVLDRCLRRILSLSWLSVLPKGGVFLMDTLQNNLHLVVEQGLPAEILGLCSRLALGRCHCGRAAVSRQVQYSACIDARHEVVYPGIVDHGHYSIPLLAGEVLLGVLVLYLPLGFQANAQKEEFLTAAANALAGIIQRKLDEAALRERERLFRSVVDTSADGFFMADMQGRLLEVNDVYVRLSGYSREELLGMRIHDLKPDGTEVEVNGHFERTLGQGWNRFETQHRAKDGHIWPVEASVSYVAEPDQRFFVFTRDISNRLALERQLSESRSSFLAMIDNLPFAIWFKDTDCRLRAANIALLETLGERPRASVIGKNNFDLWPADLAAKYDADDREVMASRTQKFVEEPYEKSGYRFWIETYKAPVHDKDGVLLGTVGYFRDITRQRNASDQLRELNETLEQRVEQRTRQLETSRRQLEVIIDTLPALLFIKDLDGRYLTVNQRYEKEVGVSKAWVLGRTDLDLYPSAVAEAIRQIDQRAITAAAPITFEENVPHHDGRRHDYLTTKLPLLDASGKPHSLLGIAFDITPIKMLQAQLTRTQSIARLGSWQLQLADGGLTWSDETYGIFAMQPGSRVTIDSLVERIHPDDLARAESAWEGARQGRLYDIEYRIILAEQTKWVRERVDIITRENDRYLVAEGFVQDITEFKHTQETLQLALRDAERFARMKSEFLANMSHEIRTPLNGILGFAQVGQQIKHDSQGKRLFDQVFESGQLLLGIVNDILDFSKIEAGKLRIDAVAVQLERILQHVSVMCSDRASSKGFLLRIEVDEALPPWFQGDPLRIAQILINLVGNAIKFTERGEVVLSARRESDRIVFRVSDTGIGMAPELVNNLFKPFEQGDGSITRRFGGTGLGLAITHRLVDLMGGEIRVDSTPNLGSVFEVHLALSAVPAPAAVGRAEAPASGVPTRQSLAGVRVLTAEDNAVNRMVLEDLLTMQGIILRCVENGQQALDVIRHEGESAWDIVLTDIHMPVMDGHQLTRQLREIAPNLPVVGVTAHAMAEERERCLASGMVAHVAKPIVLDELLSVIRRFARHPTKNEAILETEPSRPAQSVKAPEPGVAADASPLVEPLCPTLAAFIDRAALMAHFNGRQAFIHKLLAALLSSHRGTPEKLRAAVAQSNHADLAFAAHSLASAVGAMQAHDLRAFAKRVEELARQGRLEAFGLALELATKTESFLAAVQRELPPDPSVPSR